MLYISGNCKPGSKAESHSTLAKLEFPVCSLDDSACNSGFISSPLKIDPLPRRPANLHLG